MIKLKKDLTVIPTSLIPAFPDLFPRNIPRPTQTTHDKRTFIINGKKYIDKDEFNNRYKTEDIRNALIQIYKHKCAFCEQKMERYNIEHYRPKNIYYWLAFSWDNLILACPTCNGYKGTNFELEEGGIQATFDETEDNVRAINNSSATYDASEKPQMVNPEITDPHGQIAFQKNGLIESNHDRFVYTIETCQINRKYLNDDRRKLLDDFRRDIRSALLDNIVLADQHREIVIIAKKFIRDSQDDELSFLAFRRYAISKFWLNDLIKEEAG
jgi:uncharacterized protein (TIGR02646 family)